MLAYDGHARRSVLSTPHGDVDLPTFMPVGTQGSVKTLAPEEVASTGARVVLGNTYHLWMRPGPETISELGGLHGFSRWPHAMLTDSGGFQAFSLSSLTKLTEEGFTFRSHLDGRKGHLTPEEAVRVQGLIGADIQMQLDVCPPGESPRATVEEAVARTTRWAKRALASPRPEAQALFGIVQGACFPDLRKAHAEELAALDVGGGFDGLALGGFSVGEPIERMHETLAEVAFCLDPERPRYLMGVGTPRDLLVGIEHGVDMFDCVLPTRNARNGQALTRFGRLIIKNARHARDPGPIDPQCGCAACRGGFSRAYLRHLYLSGEILALRLLTLHNLHYYGELVAGARAAISEGTYASFKRRSLEAMEL
ncbi:tRNA guanosine(34) transglycosylase Tgt [Pendulispora albinea]|uniref:Queuine tRNA-ribosyltransferase n=1 Tax=Pendulispora albinea TaxID=2741071 RepID=A0ABZ2M608_9BACT